MRSNGLRLALATLLVPATVCAQTAEPAMPPQQTEAAAVEMEAETPAAMPLAEPAPAAVDTMAGDAAVTTMAAPALPAQEQAQPTAEPLAPLAPLETTADPLAEPAADPTAPAPQAEGVDPAAPTEAEQAFNDIYGNGAQGYDPIADSTLPEAAVMPGTYDPWEGYNRRMHRFNNAVDRSIAKPLARGYVKVVPRPLRLGVSNFFNNLGQPLTMVNSLL
ncbi:MAG TPA: MlaA family lipoprotein, partial [Lysobacter sp.]|nr:MlaA family lipoprotein [Lysobacter sp.]